MISVLIIAVIEREEREAEEQKTFGGGKNRFIIIFFMMMSQMYVCPNSLKCLHKIHALFVYQSYLNKATKIQ